MSSLEDAVARYLAKADGQFISAEDWVGDKVYMERALGVLDTITKYEAGHHSGGLPPGSHQMVKVGEPIHLPKLAEMTEVVSSHFTKAQAQTAASKYYAVHSRSAKAVPSGRRWKRWEVQA